MRPVLRTAAVAVASLLLAPQFVAADDVNRKIEEMMQRLEALEAEVREHRAELAGARVTVAAQQTQLEIQSAELTEARAKGGRSADPARRDPEPRNRRARSHVRAVVLS